MAMYEELLNGKYSRKTGLNLFFQQILGKNSDEIRE